MSWIPYVEGDRIEDGMYWLWPFDLHRKWPARYTKGRWHNSHGALMRSPRCNFIWRLECPEGPDIHKINKGKA